jgi:hypothetical protein
MINCLYLCDWGLNPYPKASRRTVADALRYLEGQPSGLYDECCVDLNAESVAVGFNLMFAAIA